jgi:hypothetical protein
MAAAPQVRYTHAEYLPFERSAPVEHEFSVFDSDVRVRVKAANLTAYPDASVVCGRLAMDDEDQDAIVNPVLLVEVLSPSTEQYDRGEKLEAYKQLPSVVAAPMSRQYARVGGGERCGNDVPTAVFEHGKLAARCRLPEASGAVVAPGDNPLPVAGIFGGEHPAFVPEHRRSPNPTRKTANQLPAPCHASLCPR